MAACLNDSLLDLNRTDANGIAESEDYEEFCNNFEFMVSAFQWCNIHSFLILFWYKK